MAVICKSLANFLIVSLDHYQVSSNVSSGSLKHRFHEVSGAGAGAVPLVCKPESNGQWTLYSRYESTSYLYLSNVSKIET